MFLCLCTLFYPWLFGNPSWTLRKRFGPSPRPSPSMGRVLVTLFVSFCLRCNFFSSLRGGREGAASFGSSALPLNHIAKIRRIWHTTMDFRNVNCTTLHNLNFVPERFWYSRKNDYICSANMKYFFIFRTRRQRRLNYHFTQDYYDTNYH